MTVFDDLTGAELGTATPGHAFGDCLRPTEIGTHHYRIQYSGNGTDWFPASASLDVVVGTGAPVLPERIPAGSFAPDITCQTLLDAPTRPTNQPTITIEPVATTRVILTEVRLSNSEAVDGNGLLIDGSSFPYGSPVAGVLADRSGVRSWRP